MKWQDEFKGYTRSTAFHMALSHNMVKCLWVCSNYPNNRDALFDVGDHFGPWIAAFRSVERRGLAEHNPKVNNVKGNGGWGKIKWVYRLTPAGEHVAALCEMSGLFEEYNKIPRREKAA